MEWIRLSSPHVRRDVGAPDSFLVLYEIAEARKLTEKIKRKGGAQLIGVKTNLVDLVWGDERPPRPNEKVSILDIEYAGKKFEEKIEDLRKELDKKKSAGLIVCRLSLSRLLCLRPMLTLKAMLDEIAWLFNLRGKE